MYGVTFCKFKKDLDWGTAGSPGIWFGTEDEYPSKKAVKRNYNHYNPFMKEKSEENPQDSFTFLLKWKFL